LAMLCDPAIYPPMTFPCVVRLSTALKTPRFSAMNLFFCHEQEPFAILAALLLAGQGLPAIVSPACLLKKTA
ncbi:hypothetical protein, partial [Pandoraea sp.]